MRSLGLVALAVVLIIGANFVLFTVDEAEQAILVQFGEPVGDVITKPGLKFKLPWRDVRYFDRRLLVWDGDVTQIPTLGREFILVDTTARWRIVDPLKFLRSVRDERGARTRLDDIIDSVVRDMVSSTELEEIVRSKDWEVDVDDLDDPALADRGDVDLAQRPKLGRELLEQEILTRAKESMPELGIEVDDVRIKRVNYIDSVRKQVERRMIAERQSIAERFRSEGQGRSQEILGDMERQLREIRSEAGRYRLRLQHVKAPANGVAHVRYAGTHLTLPVKAGAVETTFEDVRLPGGTGQFEAYLKIDRLGRGVKFVDVERVD
jgi:membrane protease subunit HflC